MTLMDEVVKMQREMTRLSEITEVNARVIQTHQDQINGERGLTVTLNGSMQRTEQELRRLNEAIEAVSDQCTSLANSEKTRDAVNEALRVAVEKANEKQITTRQFAIGVLTIIVTVLVAVAAQGHLLS